MTNSQIHSPEKSKKKISDPVTPIGHVSDWGWGQVRLG